jgi:hypothetical protein
MKAICADVVFSVEAVIVSRPLKDGGVFWAITKVLLFYMSYSEIRGYIGATM